MNDDLFPHLRVDLENFSRTGEEAMPARRRSTVRRDVYRAAHWYYFVRALLRGPADFLGYLLRREVRREAWKARRRMR